jgi:hypothetical protein
MNHRFGLAGLIALAAVTGCGNPDDDLVGTAQLSLTSVPAQVWCISIEAQGSGRQVQRSFDVFPGQAAVLRFSGTPIGQVVFTGRAFPTSCSTSGGTAPTWVSDPTPALIEPGSPTSVHLVLRQAGDVDIDVDFEDGGSPPDAGMDGGSDGGDSDAGGCGTPGGPNQQELVVKSAQIPLERSQFSLDLNGDGRTDNQYGNIMGALTQQGLDSQPTLTASIVNGTNVFLVQARSHDPLFQNDDCANMVLLPGVATTTPPRFDGTDLFQWDTSVPPASLAGHFINARFTSVDAFPTAMPIQTMVRLPFMSSLVQVPLVGVHVTLQHNPPGQNIVGQLNGAIRDRDVQSIMIPGIWQALVAQVASDPTSSGSRQLLAVFDSGGTRDATCLPIVGCRNPDNTCAAAGDRIISLCEVATNALIRNVLAPDVQLFSDDGTTYAPNPANTHKDSLSVGIGLGFERASISNF